MNIASRIAAWFGGKKLPYDAEVEWIGFRGTQYIRLPFNIFRKSYKLKARMFNKNSEQVVIGCRSGTTTRNYPLYANSGYWRLIYSYTTLESSPISGDFQNVSINIASGYQSIIVDNENEQKATDFSSVNDNLAYLGCANVLGNRQFFANFDFGGLEVRVVSTKELVIDLIPVVVNNEGMVFDRVSGQLFGNAGTGAFVIGPDKV